MYIRSRPHLRARQRLQACREALIIRILVLVVVVVLLLLIIMIIMIIIHLAKEHDNCSDPISGSVCGPGGAGRVGRNVRLGGRPVYYHISYTYISLSLYVYIEREIHIYIYMYVYINV